MTSQLNEEDQKHHKEIIEEEMNFNNSILEFTVFKKMLKEKDNGGILLDQTVDKHDRFSKEILNFFKRINPNFSEFLKIKTNTNENEYDYEYEKDLEFAILKYLNLNTFSCDFADVPEIVNNDIYYRELCKLKRDSRKDERKEEKKEENFFSNIYLKILFNFLKENEKVNLSLQDKLKTIPSNPDFFKHLRLISDKLTHNIYTYSNVNYEAENKICLLLYVIKHIITRYCFFFQNSDLEMYIKEFKKFKNYPIPIGSYGMDLFECLIEEYYLQGYTLIKKFVEKFHVEHLSKNVDEIDVYDFNKIFYFPHYNKSDFEIENIIKSSNGEDENINKIKYNEIILRLIFTIIYNVKSEDPHLEIDNNLMNKFIYFFCKDPIENLKNENKDENLNENEDKVEEKNDYETKRNNNQMNLFSDGGIRKGLEFILKSIDNGMDKDEHIFKTDIKNFINSILNSEKFSGNFDIPKSSFGFEEKDFYNYSNSFSKKINSYELIKIIDFDKNNYCEFLRIYEKQINELLKKYFTTKKTSEVNDSNNNFSQIHNNDLNLNEFNTNHNLYNGISNKNNFKQFGPNISQSNINHHNHSNPHQKISTNQKNIPNVFPTKNNKNQNTINQSNVRGTTMRGNNLLNGTDEILSEKEDKELELKRTEFLKKYKVKFLLFEKSLIHDLNDGDSDPLNYFSNFINSVYLAHQNLDRGKNNIQNIDDSNDNNDYNKLNRNINFNSNSNDNIINFKDEKNLQEMEKTDPNSASSYKTIVDNDFNFLIYLLPNSHSSKKNQKPHKFSNICHHISKKDYLYRYFIQSTWSNFEKINEIKLIYENPSENFEKLNPHKDEINNNKKSILKFSLKKYLSDAEYIFNLYTYEIKIYGSKEFDVPIYSKIFCQNFEMIYRTKSDEITKEKFEEMKNKNFNITIDCVDLSTQNFMNRYTKNDFIQRLHIFNLHTRNSDINFNYYFEPNKGWMEIFLNKGKLYKDSNESLIKEHKTKIFNNPTSFEYYQNFTNLSIDFDFIFDNFKGEKITIENGDFSSFIYKLDNDEFLKNENKKEFNKIEISRYRRNNKHYTIPIATFIQIDY